ncbi:MAG: hypothetical protein FWF15_03770 [Oscillospiraceae bacterium]|nr:hypothetical protein [Oscillospiraceae bacterium]
MLKPTIRPKIGLLPTGHKMYWGQYPGLKEMGTRMYNTLVTRLESFGDVISPGLADDFESASEAAELFKNNGIDILLIFPFGYTTGMMIVPVIKAVNVPIRLLNAHEDAVYEFKNAGTDIYLHHEGVCGIPEYSCALTAMGKKFKVVSGHFGEERFWKEIKSACMGAAAAAAYARCRFAVIGNTYTNMVDMPTDDHRIMRATGQLLCRPEVEEIEEAYKQVTQEQIEAMYAEFRQYYEVDDTVTDEHLTESAKIAVAFDEIIRKYKIDAFGYYWWGQKESTVELRAQSALAVSRLSAMGIPGVTEGDIKAAMAMKVLNMLGGGGMFMEFMSLDFNANVFLAGHDGPANVDLAVGKPLLEHLSVHHGKTGEGIGINFQMREGICTILNISQFGTDKPFKLIYTVGEIVPGDILKIGNPNCRVKIDKPFHIFFNEWCQQAPGHHSALGLGDFSGEIECFAEKMGFDCVCV